MLDVVNAIYQKKKALSLEFTIHKPKPKQCKSCDVGAKCVDTNMYVRFNQTGSGIDKFYCTWRT